jgi:hypothetical protein
MFLPPCHLLHPIDAQLSDFSRLFPTTKAMYLQFQIGFWVTAIYINHAFLTLERHNFIDLHKFQFLSDSLSEHLNQRG